MKVLETVFQKVYLKAQSSTKLSSFPHCSKAYASRNHDEKEKWNDTEIKDKYFKQKPHNGEMRINI